MNALILGGTRFVGAALVRRLTSSGDRVMVVHRGVHEGPDDGAVHVHAARSDLAVLRAAAERFAPDAVVDTWAQSENDARSALAIVQGVAPRVVVLSSLDVYRAYERLRGIRPGPVETTPLAESAPLRDSLFPRSGRDVPAAERSADYDKLLVERAYQSASDVRLLILRLPFLYGPQDYRRRVGRVMDALRLGNGRLKLSAAHAAWRSTRMFVDDAASAIHRALRGTDAGIFNLGESAAASESEWVAQIAAAMGTRAEIEIVDEPADNAFWQQALVTDTTLFRDRFQWSEDNDSQSNLAATVDWELAHPGPRR